MVERSEEIKHEIEQTREEMGETVDALGYKADVPGRVKGWVGDKKDAVTGAVGSAASTVVDKAPDRQQLKRGAGRAKTMAESNPLGLVIGGAALGFLTGLLAPSTRIEDERLGEMSDQVKESAKEAGQEALDHGKEVAQAAAQSATQTAQEEARSHGEELTESLQDKASEVTSPDVDEGPEIVFEPEIDLEQPRQ